MAPVALYPDSIVAQVLAASTFPSQIVDAEGWLKAHPGLSAADLGSQVDQQSWDSSVKALVQFPSILANLSSNLGWTSELGDAYYNQQEDVMKAVQEMRKKAKKAGNLKPTPQLNVEDENGQIDIAPVDPDVVYVPAYDPWLVYGYPIAPWPYWVDVPGIWWDRTGNLFRHWFSHSSVFRIRVGVAFLGSRLVPPAGVLQSSPGTMRGGRHFSIAESITGAVLRWLAPAVIGDRWRAGIRIADMSGREVDLEFGLECSADSTTADCRGGFQHAVSPASAAFTAEGSVGVVSMGVEGVSWDAER